MNKLTIIGNLTKDPELRTTQNGISVCTFTVAVNRRAKDKDPEADYFNVTAWRVLGENAARFLTKGKKVAVIGSVTLRTWEKEDKHGASMEVTADDIEYLSPRVSDPVETQTHGGFTQVETDELPFD